MAWTIGELAEHAARLLGPDGQVSGRVRPVPNERLIRWYTTIGLLDPPIARRGRVALYGRRHLLQLVAIKRRQAAGLSIAAIQAELAGATDAALQRIAGLGDADLPEEPAGTAADGAPAPGPARRFWARPAALARPPRPDGTAAPDTTSAGYPPPRAADQQPAGVVHGVRLAPGVTLLLDGAGRAPTAEEAAAIRRAAGPLLAMLAGYGLADRPGAELPATPMTNGGREGRPPHGRGPGSAPRPR
ncbi:hypothetical protein TBS_02980 [Thermobispora bispora]|uniref:Transcriptional regulator, MerR family n=1 Tax=Thermobispora bispora (strain ATCC 19993 / DSM 43833 / CBS 139.67 / JCM 10125 / KCTC 9307 / NBRC 14880 / R51) TaxID=469371 RepID=D6Y9B7_THEBD|nr:helix-turn-helix domain-containing protein [Thermobispora bispora]ADG88037.1 transcriptional regulator, MerR family [Thermobispora bispora DSM 43833]MBO2474182.1 MerR family transcriptional regulator [Actinomycetales bacterium]MDI9580280.1 helix-turn-helix domain-containing protein [Thermobispora sp.]QSI47904.1 MerR family transcriptional regulator [Thermobispora bispora]